MAGPAALAGLVELPEQQLTRHTLQAGVAELPVVFLGGGMSDVVVRCGVW